MILFDELFAGIGLVLSLMGSLFVVISYFYVSLNDLESQSGWYLDVNRDLFKSLVNQKYDSILGFIFIFLGFLFQFSSIALKNILSTYYVVFALGIAYYIIIVILSLVVRVYFKKYINKKAQKFLDSLYNKQH
jgi:uncharacterized membrane protein